MSRPVIAVDVRANSHLLEPLDVFDRRLTDVQQQILRDNLVTRIPHVEVDLDSYSLAQYQTPLAKCNQDGRGTCWAFAGVGAMEAAYRRKYRVNLDLSEQYTFHIIKAHESDGGVHSLFGFGGSSDIVQHLTRYAVPERQLAPYLGQSAMIKLRNQIPEAGNIDNGVPGTQEQRDALEFDLRHIPLPARWHAKYRVQSFGTLSNFSTSDLENVLGSGHEVVVDVVSNLTGASGGHVLLLIGYNRAQQCFIAKNSWAETDFIRIKYTNDPSFMIQNKAAFYIKDVVDPNTPPQPQAFWIGNWRMDHDGFRGALVIRRFTNLRGPDPGSPETAIKLGSYYRDGAKYDVNGYFIDNGNALMFSIADTTAPTQPGDMRGQRFEVYLFSQDVAKAAGKTTWNNVPYGVILSRDMTVGVPSSSFEPNEFIGNWDLEHDGWRGTLHIGPEPWYKTADNQKLNVTYSTSAVHHVNTFHIPFAETNIQKFDLLYHTREDGVLSGTTVYDGQTFGVQGFKQAALYGIKPSGELLWYRHDGQREGTFEWGEPKHVGTGWQNFSHVFSGDDGVIYAVQNDGVLLWYLHKGRSQGTSTWAGPKQVGTGWQGARFVFSGGAGVIYVVSADGILHWYRHEGRADGSFSWKGPKVVGSGWAEFKSVFSCGDGSIYAVRNDGALVWYMHYGHNDGLPIWSAPQVVGSGWQNFKTIIPCRAGVIYGIHHQNSVIHTGPVNTDLLWYRHDGFHDGSKRWLGPKTVGKHWASPTFSNVIAT